MLIAYASAPGTVAPDRPGDYGAYATAIAEMLRAPGTDLDTAFTHIRSRTHLTTEGSRRRGTSRRSASRSNWCRRRPRPQACRRRRRSARRGRCATSVPTRPMRWRSRWTRSKATPVSSQAYPGHPYTKRVWPMIRARREALAWMRALEFNTPQSYWTYLRRYPNGMYAFDAERRLRRLGVAVRAAAGLRDDGVRRCADGAGRRAGGIRGCLSGRPAAAAWPLWRAASGLSREPAAAAAAGGGGPGSRILPALAVGIPLVAALAPAPRRALPPDAPRAPSDGFRIARRESEPPVRRRRCDRASLAPRHGHSAPRSLMPSPSNNRPPGWGPAPGGQRPPGAARPYTGRRAAPTTLPLRRVRSRQILLLQPAPGSATPSPGGRAASAGVRPPAAAWRAASGDCQPDAAGGPQRQELLLPMQQRRTRSARRHANSLRPAPGVRPGWTAARHRQPHAASRPAAAIRRAASAASRTAAAGEPATAAPARRLGRRHRRRR